MKKMKLNYIVLLLSVLSFSTYGEEQKGNEEKRNVDKVMPLNLVCTPKDSNYEPTVLSGFSVNSLYNYREVRIWHAGAGSRFIPTEIQIDEVGNEIMKGKLISHRGKRAYVEFKDGSYFTHDIYTTKNEWDCVSNKK